MRLANFSAAEQPLRCFIEDAKTHRPSQTFRLGALLSILTISPGPKRVAQPKPGGSAGPTARSHPFRERARLAP